jgi:hypothetical protein
MSSNQHKLRKSAFKPVLSNPSVKSDRKFVLGLMPTAGYELEFADLALRADQEVVLAAVKWGAYAFTFADASLRSDPSFVLKALAINDDVFKYLDTSLLASPEFLLAATQFVPQALDRVKALGLKLEESPKEQVRRFGLKGLAHANNRADREAVVEAARRFGMGALKMADPTLKLDWDVVLPAVGRDLSAQRIRLLTRLPAAYSGPVEVDLDVAILIDTSQSMASRMDAIKTTVSMLIESIQSGDPNKDVYQIGGAYNVIRRWRAKVLGFHFDKSDKTAVFQDHPFFEDGADVSHAIDSLQLTGSAELQRPILAALAKVCRLPASQKGITPVPDAWHHEADAARLVLVFSGGQDRQAFNDLSDGAMLSVLELLAASKILLTLVAPEVERNLILATLDRAEFYSVEQL